MATLSEGRMCDACLVSGRSVAPLGSLRHVFAALTDCAVDTEHLLACWECVALLRRAARFRHRAARVQFCLQTAQPLDSLDFELGSFLCVAGPVAEIHINPETEDEQLTDIKCEYNSENDYDLDSAFSVPDTFEEQMLNHDIKTENKDSVDLKCEFDNVKSTNYVDVSTTTNLKEGEKKYSSIKLSTKEIQEHLDEKRKSSAFINAEYKCVKCAIILHKKTYRKHLSLHKNTHKNICHVCKIRLRTKSMLQRHLGKHYLQYQCSHCPFTTESIYVIRNHKCKQHLESDTSSEEAERKYDTNNSSGSTYNSNPFEETLQNHRDMIEHTHSHDITEFRCNDCDFSAESDKLIETHTREAHRQTQEQDAEKEEAAESQSTIEPTLTCEICKKPFFSVKSLQEHVNKYHNVGTAKTKKVMGRPCTRKSVIKLSEEEMWKYREQEANSVTFRYAHWKCEKCILTFYTKLHFSRHERLHLLKFNFICNICTMPIRTAKALEEHKQAHYNLYKCVQCDYSSFRGIKWNHYQIHDKTSKGYQCKICKKSFNIWAEKYAHMKEHEDMMYPVKDVYECNKCCKKFTCKIKIERHLLAHERKYQCSVCPYRATSSGNLSTHYKRHHLMAPVLNEVYCIQCKKQFLTEDGYKAHVATVHNKVKTKVPCTMCDKVFSTKASLKTHTDFFHLNQRNFVCKFCNKNLSKKDALRNHIKYVHEGFRVPKTHMCTFCNQGFSTRKTLIHHIRTHTGERPHKCEYCNAAFAQQYAMKTHVKNIHLKSNHKE